jgi:hypothetical protein
MASLGKFGTSHDPIDLDFDYFGETIRVNPDASRLALVEWLDDASGVDAADVVLESRYTMRLMREAVHPDDFDRFWSTAKAQRQEPDEILSIGRAVMEAVSGFPTGRPSASSDGPTRTPPRSTAGSSSQAAASAPAAGKSTADQALAMLRQRPDLQEFVVMEEEVEAQRASTN